MTWRTSELLAFLIKGGRGLYQFAPVRSRQSYRHEAFLWQDAADFTGSMVAFVEDGLAAGEPVMVALVQEHADWLRDGLGAQAAHVHFEDMRVLGRNPARIIPAWQQFLDAHAGHGQPARGVGEPIWVGRRAEEVVECQLHEALLNVAIDADIPFWLVCPYDAKRLNARVIDEAHRSHHAILDMQTYRGSTSYGGRAHVEALMRTGLPPATDVVESCTFGREDLREVFAYVLERACAADQWSNRALDLAAAARSLTGDSVRRGADSAVVQIWSSPSALVCEVSDSTVVDDVLAGRRILPREHDQGLWSANQRCDLVQMRSSDSGTTVRLHVWR